MYENGTRDAKAIASTLKLHPFVVNKNIKHIEYFLQNKNGIQKLYEALVHKDYEIKSGKLPAELFWLETKKMIQKL